jgi:hypothetical protein
MRKASLVAAALVVACLMPSSAFAWGTVAHKYIMRRAIDLLPAELKPFAARFREEIVIRVVDPDSWRTVGWDDDPNHFLDLGVPEYGPPPFVALPRDYDAALEKFGAATLKRYGLLPWREAEMFGNLRRSFEEFARNGPYAVSNTVLFMAVASHYVQDAHQPFHATDNFDGQKSGQNGIHARFERDVFERYESRLSVNPGPLKPITSIRDAMFDVLLASHQLVGPILQADKEAIAGKEAYDDAYFEKFFAGVRPVLEKQLAASITATAGMIVGAWEQAGKPPLRTEDARPLQRVRKP